MNTNLTEGRILKKLIILALPIMGTSLGKLKYGEFKDRVLVHLEQYKQKHMQGIGKGIYAVRIINRDYILPKELVEKKSSFIIK